MKRAFTLIELLMVIAIIAVLSSLLLPSLSKAKSSAKRLECMNNVRQIDMALRMYADDHGDQIGYSSNVYYAYKEFIAPYLSAIGDNGSNMAVFICPADTTFHKLGLTYYSSYGFNGTERVSEPGDYGMAGRKFSTVINPSKTALNGEISGGIGVSWHNPKPEGQYNDAPNVGGFVDGHAAYVKIFWNGMPGIPNFPFYYEPPEGYDYQWTANQPVAP
jgi:prepilin-type N-terminal cleavage/methylation domain-containing protein